MIDTIKLTYFRQYEDRTFNFLEGLIVIKGENEKGKSTLLEAIAYALFGTKALRDTITDTVTWDIPVGKLAVEITFIISGLTHLIVRKKAGAELFVNSESKVTGHKEVTAAVEDIIGVSSKNAFNLLIAEQDAIRGAFKKGNTEATELIEKLADFDTIDSVITTIQDRLTTGSAVVAKDRVVEAQTLFDNCIVEKPKFSLYKNEIAEAVKALNLLKLDKEQEDKELLHLSKELSAGEAIYTSVENLQKRIEKYELAIEGSKSDIEQCSKREAPEDGLLGELQDNLRVLGKSKCQYEVYTELIKLPGYPEDYWDEDMDSLDVAISKSKEKYQQVKISIISHKHEIKDLRSSYIIEGVCDKCNQKIGHTDEDHNSHVSAGIATTQKVLDALELKRIELQEEGCILEDIKRADIPFRKFHERYPDDDDAYVSTEWVPRRCSWESTENPEPQSVSDEQIRVVEQSIENCGSQIQAFNLAQEEIIRVKKTMAENEGHLESFKVELENLHTTDLSLLRSSIETQEGVVKKVDVDVEEAQGKADTSQNNLKSLERGYEESKVRRENAKNMVTSAKKELEELEFNNDLLNAVRKAKPKIVDRLWSTLLHAVSAYFSTMRDKLSVVTKDSTGFRVDGKPSASLSGSAKDCLGLAIRVALSKTFLPHIPFIVLDEPFSSMDVSRTEILVGFLLSVGFTQTIVVTHETLTEGSADQLIYI